MTLKAKTDSIDKQLKSKIIIDWTNTYICEADIWIDEAISEWAITKIDTDWNTTNPIDTADWKAKYAFKFLPADATTYSYN